MVAWLFMALYAPAAQAQEIVRCPPVEVAVLSTELHPEGTKIHAQVMRAAPTRRALCSFAEGREMDLIIQVPNEVEPLSPGDIARVQYVWVTDVITNVWSESPGLWTLSDVGRGLASYMLDEHSQPTITDSEDEVAAQDAEGEGEDTTETR